MRLVSMTVLATAILAAAAGCGGSSGDGGGASGSGSDAGPTKVSVGTIPIVDVAPIYLGKKKGFFDEQKISLTLTTAQGGAAIIPGVVSGQFQFGFSNVTSLLVGKTKGLPLKVVAAGNSSTGKQGKDFGAVVVPPGSSIHSAKDLEGKTVAVNNLNNIGDTTVRASVRKDGGDPKNVKFVELAFPDMPAALANHRVDAAWVVEPFLTVATSQGNKPVAWNLADTADQLMVAAYFTTTKYAAEHSDVVKRFTEAMNRSLEYASAHPDEARGVLTDYTKIDPSMTSKLTLPGWPTEINRDSTETLADLAKQDGLVDEKPDVGALLP